LDNTFKFIDVEQRISAISRFQRDKSAHALLPDHSALKRYRLFQRFDETFHGRGQGPAFPVNDGQRLGMLAVLEGDGGQPLMGDLGPDEGFGRSFNQRATRSLSVRPSCSNFAVLPLQPAARPQKRGSANRLP
jgi:hypothetical protein